MKNQKGFASVPVLIFAFLGLLITGVWMYVNSINNSPDLLCCMPLNENLKAVESNYSITENWKTYRNEKYGVEFKYPIDWQAGFWEPASPSSPIQDIVFSASKEWIDESGNKLSTRIDFFIDPGARDFVAYIQDERVVNNKVKLTSYKIEDIESDPKFEDLLYIHNTFKFTK